MEIWAGKVAVVTGASAGIGAAIALDLAKAGLHVVGLARRKQRIEDLAVTAAAAGSPGKIYAHTCDVTNVESIREAFKWIKDKFGKVHILINNAGRGRNATTLDSSVSHEDYLTTINVNVSGVVVCTREAYKLMESHDEPGYIINVNSIAGHTTPQAMTVISNVYAATKHAITNHTEQLRLELAVAGNKRIRVTSLSPGVVQTEFMDAAGFDVNSFGALEHLEAKDVADAILYILSLPAHVNVSELTIRPVGEKF